MIEMPFKTKEIRELLKKEKISALPLCPSTLDMPMSVRSSPRAEYSSESRSRSPSRASTIHELVNPNHFDRAPSPPRPAGPVIPVGPVLQEADIPARDTLVLALNELITSHARFSDRTREEVKSASSDFVRYGIKSLDAVKRSTKEARKFFMDDLRKVERKAFPELSFIIELFDHLPVNIQNEQSDDKVRYTEVDIPRALLGMRPALSELTGLLRPDQRMVNWIQRERAKGFAKIPPYTPYLVPSLSSPPWLPDVSEHRNSYDSWARNARQARRNFAPQELPLQSWLLYHMRFLMAGECCAAFTPFGGLCAQLNLVAIVLNLSVTENVGLGLTYFKILSSRLEESARQRIIAPNEFSVLLNNEQLDVKEQARRELSLAFRQQGNRGQPATPFSRARNQPAGGAPPPRQENRPDPRPDTRAPNRRRYNSAQNRNRATFNTSAPSNIQRE